MLYTQFAGVTFHNGTTIRQLNRWVVGNRAITNIFYLSNGVKYDVDGTGDGAVVLRRFARAVPRDGHKSCRCLDAIAAVARRAEQTRHACRRRIRRVIEYELFLYCAVSGGAAVARIGMAMATGKVYQIEIDVRWELFSSWVLVATRFGNQTAKFYSRSNLLTPDQFRRSDLARSGTGTTSAERNAPGRTELFCRRCRRTGEPAVVGRVCVVTYSDAIAQRVCRVVVLSAV